MATNRQLQLQYLQLFHLEDFPYNRFARLIRRFGSLAGLLAAPELADAETETGKPLLPYLHRHLAELESPGRGRVADALAWLDQAENHHLICYESAHYPALLRETPSPPPLLFLSGDPAVLKAPQIAIVGSRKASRGGEQTAFVLARDLARSGIVITSGFAAGIDSQAHRGALRAGGATVAVLGTGIDRIYPARHQQLAGEVLAAGALVSEFPVGTGPLAGNFPQRNRIIAGLSLGTVVVEAALRSGSLITARLSLEINREVFAVPGSIHSSNSRGCHRLIREGAMLVESAAEIVEELAGPLRAAITRPDQSDVTPSDVSISDADPGRKQAGENPKRRRLSGLERQLLDNLGFDPCAPDVLAQRSGLPIEVVIQGLTGLELKGLLESGGGRYRCLPHGLQPESD